MKKQALQFLLATSIITASATFAADTTTSPVASIPPVTNTQTTTTDLLIATNAQMKYNPASSNAAGYFTLTNTSNQETVIISAALDSLDTTGVELHQTNTDTNGVSKMAKVDKIVVPANGSVEFKPGGTHVMIMGLKSTLKTGDTVKLTLHFADGKSQNIPLTIQ